MQFRLSTLLLSSGCFLCGCEREEIIPSDSFRLTVQEVVSESDVRVSLLTIRLSRGASISVDGDGFHRHVILPDPKDGKQAVKTVVDSVQKAADAAADQAKQAAKKL